ncbi:SRPBCC family protein [Winogradskyella sp.]|uniref:SRPBCC family protein n=1 Tax=Winogradskyella sp. TaxID=1883156 RepID=UPI003F6D82A3
MKALKYVLLLLLIFIIGFCIYIAVQPNSFEVTRTKTINAPQPVVYNNVIDFKNWESWSSWVEENPETKITLADQTKGIGGSYFWEDDDGVGTMKTVDAEASSSITQKMQFGDFPNSDVTWDFKPNEDGITEVTWTITGKHLPFVFKAFSTVMGGMEQQIGPHFERSLTLLDSVIVEDMNRHNIEINGITEYGGGFYLYKTTNANSQNMSAKMAENFGTVMEFMGTKGLKQSGMPLTVYNDMSSGNVIMSNGIPVNQRIDIPEGSDVSLNFIPKTKVLKTTLTGNYTYLSKAWAATMKYIAKNGLEQADLDPFEIYTTDPGNYPNPADWKTEIYIPIK